MLKQKGVLKRRQESISIHGFWSLYLSCGPCGSPPGPLTVHFPATQGIVSGLPASFPFPASGDLRLRLADLTRVGSDVSITPILTIGGPAFLAKFVSGSMKGDQVLYIWPRFLDQSYSGTIYESVIKFMANQYTAAPASLTVTVTDNKTVLTWLAGTPGNRTIAGYGIYKSDASGKYATTPTATVDASTLTWTDTLPAAGINSYYIVRAIDSGPPAQAEYRQRQASLRHSGSVHLQVPMALLMFRRHLCHVAPRQSSPCTRRRGGNSQRSSTMAAT